MLVDHEARPFAPTADEALQPPDGPEALFEEARQRQRRRRLRLTMLALGAGLAGLAVYALVAGGAHSSRAVGAGGTGSLLGARRPAVVVLVVDMSGSMGATDIHPTRLTATVRALRSFLTGLPRQEEVGLVTFSESARQVVAPTLDRKALTASLASLSPAGGTALGEGLSHALDLTVSTLGKLGLDHKREGFLPADVVLISDGAQNRGAVQPLAAALRAHVDGVRVYGIALGTKTGSMRFGAGTTGTSVPVPPDPAIVRAIGAATGADSYDATSAPRLVAALQQITSRLRQ
jgi:Ca-activated chloride channel family protein